MALTKAERDARYYSKHKDKLSLKRKLKYKETGPIYYAGYDVLLERHRRYMGVLTETISRPMPEKCEACGGPSSKMKNGKFSLHCDHNHKTGVFRAWLCRKCNLFLGHLDDSSDELIQKLMELRNMT